MSEKQDPADPSRSVEVATLAGGCFWCLEALFVELKGVIKVVPGYSGGTVDKPSYHQVCAGTTGHAEAVQVTFDPEEISYSEILKAFFAVHDPTTLNRQGSDVGSQYRSAVFYRDQGQKVAAEQVIRELDAARIWDSPIVTEVLPLESFHPAEEYHRDYYGRNPGQPYCRAIIAPKLAKFRREHLDKLKR